MTKSGHFPGSHVPACPSSSFCVCTCASLPIFLILCVPLWGPQGWAKCFTTRSPWEKAQFVGFADFHVVNVPTMVDFSWQRIRLQYRRPHFNSWVGKIPWRRDRLPTPVFWGFPCGSAGKESTCNVRDLGSIPGLGRCRGEGKGYPLQYSDLENSMESQSLTRLNDFHLWKVTGFGKGCSVVDPTDDFHGRKTLDVNNLRGIDYRKT